MGILGYLIVGLICGALAKAILKDRAVGGWLASLVIGVVGAIVGGFLGSALLGEGIEDFFSIQTWLLALAGSILVLVIYTAVTGRRKRT
ncbi:GlsB/YeaQ/YmgE family stress response membrane protein [Ruania suaedae]|uniref:GlsB/YeaQ/YmgE family stress response membrane protein n=1 Tax=Ruania suaedae TaxID=2897774 RepID=UPI001E5B1122|nr:GlsB/YeaQ/YmgE family stress response membrane protein [Ruania suaedae]UFU02973.1 GlsB/YeaQ/YmgE family stress response membrane protein [Ruania suaedae]